MRAIYGDESATATSRWTRWTAPTPWRSCTEWNEFRNPDFDEMRRADERRSSSTAATSTSRANARAGFTYYSIGRATVVRG